jgi:hypothetical protein
MRNWWRARHISYRESALLGLWLTLLALGCCHVVPMAAAIVIPVVVTWIWAIGSLRHDDALRTPRELPRWIVRLPR